MNAPKQWVSRVRENIFVFETGDIHRCPNRQKFIGCLRNMRAPFAFQPCVQRVLQPMEIQNVVRGVFELRFRQFRRPTIGGLLLL